MIRALLVLCFLSSLAAKAQVYTYGVLGDAGVWNSETKKIQNSMRTRRNVIKELILPGDNLYDLKQSYFDVWSHWIGFDLSVVAIGNHHKGYKREVEFFRLPGEYYSKSVGKDLLFLVLNSDNRETEKDQASWLRRELEKADQQFVVVTFHHPPYTVSERHGWKERKEFHERVRPILHEYSKKINLLIVGHDHIASLIEINKIPMIVSGASFEAIPSKAVDYEAEDGVDVRTRWLFNGRAHWARLDFNTEANDIWINFVQADPDKVVCSAKLFEKRIEMRENCKKGIPGVRD